MASFAALLAGCSTPGTSDAPACGLTSYAFAQAHMGLEFRMTLFATNDAHATRAASAAFARIAELNDVLSDYDADSELSRLSAGAGSGSWSTVSHDLWKILSAGQRLAAESDGAFDLTVGPSVNLWRRVRRQQQPPDIEQVIRMRARVGYRHLELDKTRRAARLMQPEMRLDAGGIAKGFALDEALRVLRAHGIRQAMIQGGGDLIVADPPPGRSSWRVGLTNAPAASTQPAAALLLSNCALATSGDLFQFVEFDGVRYSHIVDPRTGIGLTNRTLVHVIAPNGITADSLSTAISVLGPEQGIELANRHPGVASRVLRVTEHGLESTDSAGFADYLEPTTR